VIRRGFWLAAGAAGGILGYRRVAALGRRVSGRLAGGGLPGQRQHHVLRETYRFTRDVREGMELYMVRHPRPAGSTLKPHHDDDEGDGR
jgi:hypothetical protein